jgi:predicted DNA-binding transcriptional regulator YafY
MLLLQTYRRMTAHDLADRLEVSERTIHRDMESLSVAGVPVVAERGAGGGWSLLGEYRTNLTGLNEAEIQARVEALFDVEASTALTDAQKRRVVARAGSMLRAVAQDERSQTRNRELAIERLVEKLRRSS